MTQSPSSFPFEVQPTGWTHYRRRRELRGREGPTSSSALSLIITTNSDGSSQVDINSRNPVRQSIARRARERLPPSCTQAYIRTGENPLPGNQRIKLLRYLQDQTPVLRAIASLLHRRSKADSEEDFNFPRIRRSKKSRSYKGTRLSQRSRESPHAGPLSGNPGGIS